MLLGNIRHVFAAGDPEAYLLPDDALQAFMAHCSNRIGEAYFRTPRNSIKQFVHLLNILEQNRQVSWQDLIGNLAVEDEGNPDLAPLPDDEEGQQGAASPEPATPAEDELAKFTLK